MPSRGLSTISASAPSTSTIDVPGARSRTLTGPLIPQSSFRRLALMAPGRELRPVVGLHELGPAAIEVAHRLLARLHLGEVDHLARHAEPLIGIVGHGGAATLVVVVGIAPGDRAAARRMGVVPVFHVVLLGHAGRAGVADVIVAQELLDLAGRLAIDEEPAPAFRLMRPARVPHRHRPRLARQQRSVGEDLAGGADQARLFAAPTLPLLLAVAEVLGDDRRIQVGGRRTVTGRETVGDRTLSAIGEA